MSRRHLISSARLIAGLTLVSRVLGLVRDMVCAATFSKEVWHYFATAFMLPNLFRRLFGEGALSAALIPVYTEELSKDKESARALASSMVTLLFMVLAVLTLLGEGIIFLYREWAGSGSGGSLMLPLAAVMLPYMIFICLVAAIGGLLNVHRHFAAPAAAPILLNICIIGAIVFFRDSFGSGQERQIFVVAVSVVVAGFLQLLLQYPAMRRAGIRLRWRFDFSQEPLRKVVRLMAPMVIGLSAMQINAYFDYLIAHFLSATEQSGSFFTIWGRQISYPVEIGANSYLYYAQRLYQMPLGIFGIPLATAIFPLLSKSAVQKDHQGFADSLNQGFRLAVFVALPATLGLILVRTDLVRVLFERGRFTSESTSEVSWTLLFYSLGMSAYFLQQIAVRAFYAYQDSVTPVKIALRMIVLNLLLNLVLIWPLRTGGLAFSTSICATIQVVVLLRILSKRYGLQFRSGLFGVAVRTALASVVMVGGYLLIDYICLGQASSLVRVGAAVISCVLLFAGASWLLKNPELGNLFERK
ncbi:MAG: murein biosynthesis integral membrane protein MurJ [Sedimentisphaerales bacterium]|nr:murein biosynthesis integral membrane protein MurJ [Sedimentisphaerales bacterium]